MKTSLVVVAVLAIPFMALAGKISGVVKLPAGETIPPGANVLVELRDVSKADASAMLLGKCDVRDGGGKDQAAFAINFEDKKIAEGNSYAVSCRITHKGRLLFISDSHVPVITHSAPVKDVELPVAKVKR